MMKPHAQSPDDERMLDACIDAARGQFSADAIDIAGRRLRSRLPRLPRTRSPRGLRWAGAVLTVLVALVAGPQLMPGSGGSAFAQVQKWFSSYRTVHVRTVMRMGENTVSSFDVWSDDSGATRVDMGEMVLLVDPAGGEIHTLMPGQRVMSRSIDVERSAPASMDWLQQIREFRGEATRLEARRRVDGVDAVGFRLQTAGMTLTLWTDPADDRPLRVEGELPGGLVMENVLVFNAPLPEDVFTIPEGYRPVDED